MLTIIDLGHVFWRNWYAAKSDVGAYERTIEACMGLHHERPDILVACDSPHLIRRDIYPQYKANREAKPASAIDSLTSVENRVEDWGIPVVRADGYEADDVIATVCEMTVRLLGEAEIVSNDKDLYQLICPQIRMRVGPQSVGADECKAKFGVRPDQMRDWLALVGDTADNIPGCPGVGPGRASDLLAKFGSLQAITGASPGELSSVRGIGEKTISGLQLWDMRSFELVSLRKDVPLPVAAVKAIERAASR